MITADQIIAHCIGDYILQSDWMASKKRISNVAAAIHAATYSICFLVFSPSWKAMFIIFFTHFLIDRYGIARYVVWAKNFLAPKWLSGNYDGVDIPSVRNLPWSVCSGTGYPPDRPSFLAVWLLIIADNVLHIFINGAALKWL